MTTRQELLSHIRKTKRATGIFGRDNWRSNYEVFPKLKKVWFGRKIWNVPNDILAVLDNN